MSATRTTTARADILDAVPPETVEWLLAEENPAVAVLTRRALLGKSDDAAAKRLWKRRNEYEPVARILAAQLDDGSWITPGQDYKKYQGSLWQVHFLGELYASGGGERVQRAADYAFSRQLDDGSWSCSNGRPAGSITCLTANVGRALARLGWERDERVIAALEYCTRLHEELGVIDCRFGGEYQLNGYCHMLTPKLLMFLGEIPHELWPDGANKLRDACVSALRDKQVFRSLPAEAREFQDAIWSKPAKERDGMRESFLTEIGELHYKEKPGWLRFGYPLSYNSDVLEALWALSLHEAAPRPEYAEAIEVVRKTADKQMRWKLRNTFNGKMLADIEVKGEPSRWLTLRASRVLEWAGG